MDFTITSALVILLSLSTTQVALSQNWLHPAIERYGDVVQVPHAEWMPDSNRSHRIVFDLASSDTLDGVNKGLWYLARLRNLLELAGVPADSVQLVGVLHGGATTLAFSDAAAQRRDGSENASLSLMRELAANGTSFYVCGQSAAKLGIDLDTELNDITQVALSAMTTLIGLKEAGYVSP